MKPKMVLSWECAACKRLHPKSESARWCCYAPPIPVEKARARVAESLELLLAVVFVWELSPRARAHFIRFRQSILRHHSLILRRALRREGMLP